MKRRIQFSAAGFALLIAVFTVYRLPLYGQRLMPLAMHAEENGDAITLDWQLNSLVGFLSDYQYLGPAQQPQLWLAINIGLYVCYVALISLVVYWIAGRLAGRVAKREL